MHETTLQMDDEYDLSPKTFKRFLYSLYLSSTKFQLFEEINNVFNSDPFSFGTISFSKEANNLEIMVKEKDFRLPIKNLGSGILQCLYIITAIIYNKKKVICIEELEQNLSPKKQFAIFEKIKSMIGADEKKIISQIIISSHSPVYANPKLGTIYLLENKTGQTVVDKKEETAKSSKKLTEHFAPSMGRGTYTRGKGWDLI